ncbi:Uncharacterised protein [Escherichia coli]|uniref:Uncharacterized protein n=1 Tax=Escherichia coli TaxID=562 RepID=A0A376ZLY4_ECOLX|nr:Uncharacterised protein [Escherichia coli]
MRPTISQQSVGLIRQGLLLFFRFRRQKTFQHNQCRTDTNGSIGKVEGGEVPVADVEVDHIDNEAVPQAVEQVAQRAANNQRISDIV